jgi:hypothetical protein
VAESPSTMLRARATVSAQLSEMQGALDGFPVNGLLDYCLAIKDRDDAVDPKAQELVDHILIYWTNAISHDLERFPAVTTDALQSIRQRMIDARDALQRVRSLLQDLRDMTSMLSMSNEWRSQSGIGEGLAVGLRQPSDDARSLGNAACDPLCKFDRAMCSMETPCARPRPSIGLLSQRPCLRDA